MIASPKSFFEPLLIATVTALLFTSCKKKDDSDDSSEEEVSSAATVNPAADAPAPSGYEIDCTVYWGTPNRTQRSLAIHPTDADTVIVGLEAWGVAKTTDGGSTWRIVNDGFDFLGKRGTDQLCPEEFREIAFAPSNPDYVYALHYGGPKIGEEFMSRGLGTYLSTDGGETWSLKTQKKMNAGGISIAVHPQDPLIAWVTLTNADNLTTADGQPINTVGVVYKTSDGGGTWDELDTNFQDRLSGSHISVDGTGTRLIMGTPVMGPDLNTKYAVTQIGLQISNDGGSSWSVKNAFGNGEAAIIYDTQISPSNPDIVLVSSQIGAMPNSYYSDDGGATFSPMKLDVSGSPMDVTIRLFSFDHSVSSGLTALGFNANSRQIYKTVDGGKNWVTHATAPALPEGQTYTHIAVSPSDGNVVYLSGSYASVYRSTDGGVTYSLILSSDDLPAQ